MNEEKSADLAAITNGAEEAISNANLNVDPGGDEEGNADTSPTAFAGPECKAAEIVSTAGADGVIHIRSKRPNRKGAGRRQPKQPLVPARPATVANSLGISWSTARTSVDNAKSRKWGLALRQAMNAQGIADFQPGDHVEIQVGVEARNFGLIGRASRPSTAYFWIDELTTGAGVGLHEVINVIIASVHPAGASTTTDGGAQ